MDLHVFRLSNQYVEIMPLPPITSQNHGIVIQIETLVDKILAITNVTQPSWLSDKEHKQDACDTIKEYEHQIDQMVYKLYGLTEEEIKIVEGGEYGQK